MMYKNVGCDHVCCDCGIEFCYSCGDYWNGHKFSSCQSVIGKDVSEMIAIDLFTKYKSRWNSHREWLDIQTKDEYYRLQLNDCLDRHLQGTFTVDEIKWFDQVLKTITSSRQFLKSCYAFAIVEFGLDKVTMRKSEKSLETFGSLYDKHLQYLEECTMELLVSLDACVNDSVQQPLEVLFDMRSKVELITTEQQHIEDFIKQMEE